MKRLEHDCRVFQRRGQDTRVVLLPILRTNGLLTAACLYCRQVYTASTPQELVRVHRAAQDRNHRTD